MEKNELKLVARVRHIPGLEIFELDKTTGALTIVTSSRIIVRSKCHYVQALNKINAVRKLIKQGHINGETKI